MKEQNYLDCLVGVFGHPAAENPGVVIQHAAFQAMGLKLWRFLTIDVEPEDLGDAIRGLKAFKMRGINCTLPHKINVLKYLDSMSESAKLIGAVNVIVNDNGKLYGDNTDGKGFMESLTSAGIDVKGKVIALLGSGGAARAIAVEAGLCGVKEIRIVNRPNGAARAMELVNLLREKIGIQSKYIPWTEPYRVTPDVDVLVNATSVGLYPNVDEIPNVDLDSIHPGLFVQDVIPNPLETAFLKEAAKRGARCNDGGGMLINQAAVNIEMWTGRKPDKEVMYRALEEALS